MVCSSQIQSQWEENHMFLGAHLRYMRVYHRMTQKALAEKLNISPGRSVPMSAENAVPICIHSGKCVCCFNALWLSFWRRMQNCLQKRITRRSSVSARSSRKPAGFFFRSSTHLRKRKHFKKAAVCNIMRRIAPHQGTPGQGALRRNLPPEGFGYPPALCFLKPFASCGTRAGALPRHPTAF